MSKITDKKLILVIILVFLSLAINFRPLVLRLYKNHETEKLAESHPYKIGQCLVQYDVCAFNKEKEPWQEGCNPYKSFFKINQVGQKKYLVTEFFKDGKTQMKELDKLDVHRVRDADAAERNYYDIECTDVEISWELDEGKTDEPLPGEFDYSSIINKCVATENDCTPENLEPWELKSYCHPYELVYKILEVGRNKLRVITWSGHANDKVTKQITPMGEERNLNKSEFELIDFKEVDCNTMVKRFPKNFNTLTGRTKR